MTDPIRWGVLGAAKFAQNYMAPAIHQAGNAVLAGLATSSPDKAAPFAAMAPGLRVFDDYDALLADPDIDAVYVPLPNHLHVEWTLKALAAGKPVLTEKPIALTEDEFDSLIAARDKAGLLAAEAYMILHHPQWHKARDLVANGAIGTLRHVHSIFAYNNAASPGNIRNRPETAGGGIRDIGVYPFGATRFVLGAEPETVDADITWENDVDTIASVRARFGEVRMEALLSMRMHPNQRVEFLGDKGRVILTAPFNAGVYKEASVTLDAGGSEQTWRWPEARQYVLQVEAFGRALRGEEAYPVPLEFSRGTQRMIDMAFASAT
ncbi:Gfo/Idh/MocA family oxidoreductase [Alphaproteobacteria bacterium GH1-50]|uniref:Gfo/Idh/MocA family oxidoreductase n=1 Tax=Kangsaoukella pontilimi TaxID=2691042 RepID=A0A7C9IR22_9RHOB|nr:Gfo/Idh/MocA family oxidoreductase [Kangsaoukella pontilimi]MXQ06545.1 Gfo/Idh/MocA family oxidoreductase [Kangsaoukella pontilimi]